jgi:site-specific recombinase XerD
MNGCRALTDTEVKAVVSKISGAHELRDKALFILGMRSGFRIQELLSLCVGDVVENGRMRERITVARRNTKGQIASRSVILHPEAAEYVFTWIKSLGLRAHNPDCYLFVSGRGDNQPISRVQAWRILDSAFEAAGITGKTGTHTMRKTFAKRVRVAAKNDLLVVQKALGHKNIDSTISYLEVDKEEIDAVVLSA